MTCEATNRHRFSLMKYDINSLIQRDSCSVVGGIHSNYIKVLTRRADIKSNVPRATAIIMDVAHVASIGVRWNSSPGITTVYSRFSLNLVNGVEWFSAISSALLTL